MDARCHHGMVVCLSRRMTAVFSMINRIQTTALTVLSGGVLILASVVSETAAQVLTGPNGYATFGKSESQQESSLVNEAKEKGQAAYQSIQSGGSASPKADGYGSMNPAEKEAYKSGWRGED